LYCIGIQMFFELFTNPATVQALSAVVTQGQAKLAADQQALLNAQIAADPGGVMATQVKTDKDALQSTYIDPKTADLSAAVADFKQWAGFALTLNNVVKPGADQAAELQATKDDLANQNVQLQQAARMHRRRFLDNMPTGGTGFMPHTADNLAMIAFFIGYLTFFIAMWIKFVPTFKGKMIAGPIVCFLSYWFIGFVFTQVFGMRSQPN